MYRNTDLRKAIAFSLYIKTKVKSSAIPHYTINKLHNITGVSANAVRSRLATLRAYGLVENTGKNNQCLVFKSLKSHTAHRNVALKDIVFTPNDNLNKNAYAQNVKFIEKSLSVMLMMDIQNRKDFAKQMIRQSKHPKSIKELKDAKKVCNRYGYGAKYRENGISYKYIAKTLGCCVQTAFNIVYFGVKNNILRKTKKTEKRFLIGIKYFEDMLSPSYTYTNKNYACKVCANRYAWYGI